MDQKENYYAVLGVTKDSDQTQIKRAYYRLVRKHPPDGKNADPEGYQRIRRAYDTLGDEQARRQYDRMQEFGHEIIKLLDDAIFQIDSGNHQKALPLLKRILILDPDAWLAKNILGNSYCALKEYSKAEETFKNLTDKAPEVPIFWLNYGDVFIGKVADEKPLNINNLLFRARECYEKALNLDKINPEPYLAIANSFNLQKSYDDALLWCEKAINADDQTDFNDFDALFFMVQTHLISGNPEKISFVAKRIQEIIPDDTEIKLYVSARFARFAYTLFELRAFKPAHFLLKAALRFDPYNSDLKKWQEETEITFKAYDTIEKLHNDSSIIEPIKHLVATIAAQYLGEKIDQDIQVILRNIDYLLTRYTLEAVRRSIEVIKTKYNHFYKMAPKIYDGLLSSTKQQSSYSQTGSGYGGYNTAQANGCCLMSAMRLIGVIVILTTFALLSI